MRAGSAALAAAVLSVFLPTDCQRSSGPLPEGVQPVSRVLALGRAPVAMGSPFSLSSGAGEPEFAVPVRNVTDAAVNAVLWTIVPFDKAGNIIQDGETDGGYEDPLNPIRPGEEAELTFGVSSTDAIRVKLVLREVVYVPPVPRGTENPAAPRKWANPYYRAELAVARGIALPR